MYEIKRATPEGAWGATGNHVVMSTDPDGKIFMRVARRLSSDIETRWLVGELNGVRVYIAREEGSPDIHILMTTQDVYA